MENHDESIHKQLADLMDDAQQHPIGSTPRGKAITKMIRIIHKSGKINRSKWGTQPFYEEALNEVFADFTQKIDQYDRTRGASVLTWFNRLLDWKCRDWYRKTKRDRDRTAQLHFANDDRTADPIEEKISAPPNVPVMPKRSILEPFDHWLQEMHELDNIHVPSRPDISVRRLIHYRIQRHSEYPNWQALGHCFDEKVKCLQNAWDRKCKPEIENFWTFHQWFQTIVELSVPDSFDSFEISPHHQKIIELRVTRMNDGHPRISAYRVLYHRYHSSLKQGDRFKWSTLAKFFKVEISPLKTFWEQDCKPRLSFLAHDDIGRTL